MRRALAGSALILSAGLAAPLHAQSTFERLEAVSETMNAMMNDGMVAEIPALDGHMPDPEWDDALRGAYRCMYDAYVAEVGTAPVEAMVAQMEQSLETLTPAQLIETGAAVENPDGLSDDRALEIVAECELMDIFMDRMSGAMEILSRQ
ncbi:hypothetical protein [Hasllibacter sp. MH4015]|uniref:hypothetical protein n=1 Tax=Hasllibacter sp. MH4015 TaxID=2854029 RepID=UPI001CD1D990|nr:hypothetical protein [Hasllibacter sp. MH4015]